MFTIGFPITNVNFTTRLIHSSTEFGLATFLLKLA